VEQEGIQIVDIIFSNTFGVPEEFKPQPAANSVPDWYKNIESYMGNSGKIPDGKGGTRATIKRCMPVFDAITGGYILYTYADIYVSQKKIQYGDKAHKEETGEDRLLTDEEIKEKGLPLTEPHYEWPSFEPLGFHPVDQAPNHPNRNGHPHSYPKWINPWSIKTPKGYSVLFVQPMHRESVFTILPGIVDTDHYSAPVNFPFVLNDATWEGLIPAGTPMAQVIPFKRDDWKMSIGEMKDLEEQNKVTRRLRTSFFDSYKNKFRQPKNYR
jgi:hypothetical protein